MSSVSSAGDGVSQVSGGVSISAALNPPIVFESAPQPLQNRLEETVRTSAPEIVSLLYRNASVVKLILTSLPPQAKLFFSRLVPLTQAAPYPPLLTWFGGNHTLLRSTLAHLRRIKVVQLQQSLTAPPSKPPNPDGSGVSSAHTSAGAKTPPPKHEVNPEFRKTYLATVASQRLHLDHQFSSFLPLTNAEKRTLEAPTASALQTCAQKNWSNLLGYLFCNNVQFPSALGAMAMDRNITPPGPTLMTVLQLRQLIFAQTDLTPMPYHANPNEKQQRPRIPRGAFHWLLSDLSEQLSILIFTFIDGVAHSLIKAPTPSNDDPHVMAAKCLAILCDLCVCKLGEPCILQPDISQLEDRFISLANELGIIVTSTCFWNGTTHKVVYPTPLINIMVLSQDSTASGDAWTLTQMFGIQTYQDWMVFNGNSELLALPRSRYSPQCLAQGTYEVINPENFEFDFESPANMLKQSTIGFSGQQPSLTTLASKQNQAVGPGRGIVVESNFRVFSYRPDQLQISVLFNLCEVKVISPTLMVGILTRDSVMNAFGDGLTAKQIIRFFASHAHPSVKKRLAGKSFLRETDSTSMLSSGGQAALSSSQVSVLPENVSSQLELWEAQRSSVSLTDACLFEFTEESELNLFPQLVARAKMSGCLLAHTPFPTVALSHPKGPEFLQWKTQVLQRLKTASSRPSSFVAFGDNWFASGAIIVVKLESKNEMSRNITQARVGRSLLPAPTAPQQRVAPPRLR